MPPWRGQTGWAGGRKRRWQTWGANESSDPQTAAERIQFQFQTREFIDSWVVTRDLYGGLVCVNTSEDNKTAWFVSYVNYRIHPSGFDPVGLCLLVCSALLLWFHQSRMRSHLTPAGGQPLICVGCCKVTATVSMFVSLEKRDGCQPLVSQGTQSRPLMTQRTEMQWARIKMFLQCCFTSKTFCQLYPQHLCSFKSVDAIPHANAVNVCIEPFCATSTFNPFQWLVT